MEKFVRYAFIISFIFLSIMMTIFMIAVLKDERTLAEIYFLYSLIGALASIYFAIKHIQLTDK